LSEVVHPPALKAPPLQLSIFANTSDNVDALLILARNAVEIRLTFDIGKFCNKPAAELLKYDPRKLSEGKFLEFGCNRGGSGYAGSEFLRMI
jgi:hypothetical protein